DGRGGYVDEAARERPASKAHPSETDPKVHKRRDHGSREPPGPRQDEFEGRPNTPDTVAVGYTSESRAHFRIDEDRQCSDGGDSAKNGSRAGCQRGRAPAWLDHRPAEDGPPGS